MSMWCSACKGVIHDDQSKVKCAGPCGEVFHVSCAEENEYRKSRGVLKEFNSVENAKNESSVEDKQSSSIQVLNVDLLDQAINSVKQEIDHKFQGFNKQFKVVSNSVETKNDTSLSGIKKELGELRTQNEVLRTENVALVNQVKTLEIKVNNDSKMFEEFKKLLRNLSKKLDVNDKFVEEIKEKLKQILNVNKTLENENASFAGQVKILGNKVNNLEKAMKNITEKSVVPSKVAERKESPVLQSHKEEVSALAYLPISSGRDDRIISMTGTTQKHRDFALDTMGNKPVTALAGIGPVYGGRLNEHGYYKASQVYEQFIALNKNKELFQSWLHSVCGANSRWSEHCYQCLYDWNINFNGGLAQQTNSSSYLKLQLLDSNSLDQLLHL